MCLFLFVLLWRRRGKIEQFSCGGFRKLSLLRSQYIWRTGISKKKREMISWYAEEYSFLCVFKFVYLKSFNQNTHRDSVIFSVSKKATLANIVLVIARRDKQTVHQTLRNSQHIREFQKSIQFLWNKLNSATVPSSTNR